MASHSFSIRASLTNEFRAGLIYSGGQEHFPIRGSDALKTLGLEGVDLRYVDDAGGFPAFAFRDQTGFTFVGHGRELCSFPGTFNSPTMSLGFTGPTR